MAIQSNAGTYDVAFKSSHESRFVLSQRARVTGKLARFLSMYFTSSDETSILYAHLIGHKHSGVLKLDLLSANWLGIRLS